MVTLPPLANLFAFSSRRPEVFQEVAADVQASGAFDRVWLHGSWVVAVKPLPSSCPDSDEVRRRGLFFVEGRQRLLREGGHEGDDADRLSERLRDPDSLAQLPGDFGLLQIGDDGRALVVRSCAGRVPLYIWEGAESVAVATLQHDLVSFLPGEVRPDALAYAAWAGQGGFTPDDRSFVAGARLLPAGHWARASVGRRATFTRYWDPRPDRLERSSKADMLEHADALRALLVGHLDEELHPDDGNLLSLSGGVDSSSLAALAVGVVRRPIATLSFVPPGGPSLDHELSYITPLLDRLGVKQRFFEYATAETAERRFRNAPASVVPPVHPVLALLPDLLHDFDVRTYFGGEFCDDLFGSGLTLPDWHAAVPLRVALARTGVHPHGKASSLRWLRYRSLAAVRRPIPPIPSSLPEVVRPELAAAHLEWRARRRRALAADRRPWCHLFAKLSLGMTWVEMNWELTSPLGVRRVLPFCTRDVIGLAVSCHPEEVLADGPKTLLRHGLAGDVPEHNLHRPDKGQWVTSRGRSPDPFKFLVPNEARALLAEQWIASAPTHLPPGTTSAFLHMLRSLSESSRVRRERAVRLRTG